jgi:hypothetical protein
MRRALMTGLAAATAIAVGSPAIASVVLTDVNGPNLTTAIKASTTDTQNDNVVVFGSTLNSGQSADVTFTANTPVHITDGAGYAAISDSPLNNGVFTAIVSDPVPGFSAYQFSIQLVSDSFVLVQYELGSTWFDALGLPTAGDVTNPFAQNANTLKDYQITATAGEVINAIRVSTCATSSLVSCNNTGSGAGTGSGIFLFKQNSINEAVGAVPEPATWAMMLLGFGGIGVAMRRRRKPALAQIA